MEAIQIFHNDQFGDIRTAGTPEQPLFCLADLCKVLDLRQGDVAKRLSDGVVSTQPILDSLGRTQNANFVDEDGMFDAILESRKPNARSIRKWVTSEILPSVRKTGGYMMASQEETPEEIMSRALIIAQSTIERIKEQAKTQERLLIQSAPKVDYFDTVLQSTSTYCTDQIAKELGMTAIALNKKLAKLDIQFRRNEQWVLTAKHVGKGYTKTNTHTHTGTDGFPKSTMSTVWTEAGRLFIHNLLTKQLSA
jgi:anti-repressor protein